ncbi:Serine beta-lactamase-like protein LACTB, mitochondrial, partial [Stegodyphus mimosarum]
MTNLFKQLGMKNTYIDDNDVLIYHRSRNYIKAKNGYLINAPYVNNSYKLAGGGFLSTVGDLLHFGNAMLYSLQFKMTTQKVSQSHFIETSACNESTGDKNTDSLNDRMSRKKQILPGYLNSKTVEAMWSPIADYKESKYGMGWAVFPGSQDCQYCEENKYCVYHSGGAIGASSILLILPKECHNEFSGVPKGIVVSILTNLQSINLYKTALTIANIFEHQQLTMHNNQ